MPRSVTLRDIATGQLVVLAVESLFNHPRNRPFSRTSEDFRALVKSVREKGVLVPLIVRPRELDGQPGACHEILAGHRRVAAAIEADLEHVPCIIRSLDDREALEFVVCENLEREDPDPLAEASGIAALTEMGWDIEAIASRCGRSPSWVMRRKALTGLIDPLRRRAADPDEPLHAKPITWLEELARLPVETQERIAVDLFGNGHQSWSEWDLQDFETLTDLQGWIAREYLSELKRVGWSLDDETLYPEAGACSQCPKRSSCQPLLFEDLAGDGTADPHDRCLDAACFKEKARRHLARTVAEKRARHPNLVVVGKYSERQDKKIQEAIGRPIADPYALTSCKKSDPGAVPVINISKASGQVQWMKPHKWPTSLGKSMSRATKVDGKAVTPLKERRAQLEARRQAHVLTEIRRRLDEWADGEASPPRCVSSLRSAATLALVFGTANDHATRSDDHWKAVGRWDGRDEQALAEALLRDVMPQLHGLLQFFNTAGAADVFKREAGPLCRMLNIDLLALEAAAAEAIPEPKGWANLKADGTPKGTKGKPAKTTEAAKKATAEPGGRKAPKVKKGKPRAKAGPRKPAAAERYTAAEAAQVVDELDGSLPAGEAVKAAACGSTLLANPEMIPVPVRRAAKTRIDLCVAQTPNLMWAATFRIANGSVSAGALPTANDRAFELKEDAILHAIRAAADHHLGKRCLVDLEAFERAFTQEWACSECGCTNERGCAAGCHWVMKNLCSECVDAVNQDVEGERASRREREDYEATRPSASGKRGRTKRA